MDLPSYMGYIAAWLLYFSLLIISLWFLFRAFIFIGVFRTFSKIRKRFYYFCELIFLICVLFCLSSFGASIILGTFKEISFRFITLIITFIIFLYVSFKGFTFSVKENSDFINKLPDFSASKFGGNKFLGALWGHFIKISELSKNSKYKKFENLLFLLLIIGLILIFLTGISLWLIIWLKSGDNTYMNQLIEIIISIAILIFIISRVTKKVKNSNQSLISIFMFTFFGMYIFMM
ncbi:MAG: hypothetical protein NTU63_03460 [Candidatus Pacearchaeota archaeon]|nr:hypothetical protein [Candidatus Pacearchaeota archaeon]